MMKTFKFFSFVWLLLATTTLFVACGDDDDPQDQPVIPIDNNSTGGNSPDSDTGNTNMEDAVVTGGVADLSSNSVTIYGYVNNDDPQALLGMGIVYGTESDAAKLAATGTKVTASSFDPGTNNRRFSVHLTGLIPYTTYYYYAFAGQKTANDILSFMAPGICPDKNHPHTIDLGLPSGTKWACCNIGASVPEEYGNYYAWGETSPKNTYYEDTYAYYNMDIGSDIASTGYDVATANWGNPWRMPSVTQIYELYNKCTSTWFVLNDVNGLMFTGPNGAQLFLPAAGFLDDVIYDVSDKGRRGNYWSSELDSDPYFTGTAFGLSFDSKYTINIHYDRYKGLTVRPVRKN